MKPLLREGLRIAGVQASDLDDAVREARALTHHVHMVTGLASRVLADIAQKPMHPRVKKFVEAAAKATQKAHAAAETMVTTRLPGHGAKR